MARRWTAVLARLGTPTGDGRVLSPGGITSRDLPLPLMWQRQSSDGHGGSEVVGRIESINFHQDMVSATGSMLESAPPDVTDLLEAGVIGPSVDLDDLDYVMDESERIVITSARIAGATLVSIPAFADVSLTLSPAPAEPASVPEYVPDDTLFASVRTAGWSDMPIADESRDWDGSAAASRVAAWAGVNEDDAPASAWAKYARAFLRRDDDADAHTKGAYGFGIADVIDGTLTIVPRGVFAAAAAVQGARSGSTPDDASGMKRVLRGIYNRLDREAPFSLAASAASPLPPAAWFERPDMTGPTPLTVTEEGRVFGHIAPWDSCHVGLPGCVTPPASFSSYAYFHTGEQETADGTRVPTGSLTVGGGHADPKLGFRAAAEHYDDVGAAVARVHAGEDEFGIWVTGWILPTAPADKVETFKASPVSGDWRRIGGNLEMIAVCAVNSPGFPVLRRVSFSMERGGQTTLIGQFKVNPEVTEPEEAPDPPRRPQLDAKAEWVKTQWRMKGHN